MTGPCQPRKLIS